MNPLMNGIVDSYNLFSQEMAGPSWREAFDVSQYALSWTQKMEFLWMKAVERAGILFINPPYG